MLLAEEVRKQQYPARDLENQNLFVWLLWMRLDKQDTENLSLNIIRTQTSD